MRNHSPPLVSRRWTVDGAAKPVRSGNAQGAWPNMAEPTKHPANAGPLTDLDEWESAYHAREDAEKRESGKSKEASEFRDYRADVRPGVREFYRINHTNQTLDFVLAKKEQYLP